MESIGSTIDAKLFKEELEKWMQQETDNGFLDEASKRSILSGMEKAGYNLNEYMSTHSYNMIDDVSIREYFVVYMCLPGSSIHNIIPINTESNRTMGDVNILSRNNDCYWGDTKNLSDFDVYCRLFFCESEEDVWDIFADGIGNLEDLINYYRQHDENKAFDALLYIYGANNKFLAATTGKAYRTVPKSVKEEVVLILKDEFFDGMYDDFFIEENLEKAKLAWDTGVVEIRQEFVRDENAISILKKII